MAIEALMNMLGILPFFEVSSTNRGMHVFIGLQKAKIEMDNNTF